MTLQNNGAHDSCEAGAFERLNYYFGKLLTVRDLTAEQRYLNEKRWLLNACTAGWGVVCGLKVEDVPESPTQVHVTPGLALDHYGNEIQVCEDRILDLLPSVPQTERVFYICLQYKSCYAEPVHRPLEECGEFQEQCEYNRIRETYQLEVVEHGSDRYKEIEAQCHDPFSLPIKSEAECIDFLENPCATLIEACPSREPCSCLLLAKVTLTPKTGGKMEKTIDNCSVRKLLFSNDMLREATKCLKEQLWKIHTAKIDRRQFVPLLAQTLKGLTYRDGRNLILDSQSAFQPSECKIGLHPFHITTDGDGVWFTDQKDNLVRRLSREGKILKCVKLPQYHVGSGIAFDGKEWMWVTHHKPGEKPGKVSRIRISPPHIVQPIPLQKPQDAVTTEIVCDDQYMWIAHANRCLTRIECHDPSQQTIFNQWTDKITQQITCLAYDGRALWVGYDADNGLRKIALKDNLDKPIPPGELKPSAPVDLNRGNPKGLSFDGTHIWVGHEAGISKIDIDSLREIYVARAQKFTTHLCFDGSQIWALQPGENSINRLEIYEVESEGGLQIREKDPNEKYEIIASCFDGLFTWVTAHLDEGAAGKTGFVYRLLL